MDWHGSLLLDIIVHDLKGVFTKYKTIFLKIRKYKYFRYFYIYGLIFTYFSSLFIIYLVKTPVPYRIEISKTTIIVSAYY